MANTDVIPELKQILGAMIFGANRSVSVKELRKCIQEVAQAEGGETAAFAKVTEADLHAALQSLALDVNNSRCGVALGEIAGGSRFHSDPSCGKWLRHLLNAGKPNRLSRPALETLAIIAYRQPATRADIEAVRGVTVDHIIKSLLEMQLIKIVGRSELPGRPFQYGTTHAFLEHFGLKNLHELSSMEPMLLAAREEEVRRKKEHAEEVKGSDGAETSVEQENAAKEIVEAENNVEAITEQDDSEEGNKALAASVEMPDDDEEDEFDDDDDDDDDDEK
ncbi:MAG: SMC-Scp complex subunit ScpB [Lentisphaerae bacterium RIFOXYA12_FULL_48_11]|nr:MAG: SMC-Scp complex subunit ScpB [Lentisphaerae bacterium RIFOXYA12_FULL_48_11]